MSERNCAMRYLALRGYTREHIGRRFGVTKQRVSQIVNARACPLGSLASHGHLRRDLDRRRYPTPLQRSVSRTLASLCRP